MGGLKIVDSGEELLNVYSVLACNPETITHAKYDASMAFITFLLSDEAQGMFQNFGVADYGEALFQPWISMLASCQDPELIRWVEDYAYFEGSECPPQYRNNAGDLY